MNRLQHELSALIAGGSFFALVKLPGLVSPPDIDPPNQQLKNGSCLLQILCGFFDETEERMKNAPAKIRFSRGIFIWEDEQNKEDPYDFSGIIGQNHLQILF